MEDEQALFEEGERVEITLGTCLTGFDLMKQDFSTGECVETRVSDAYYAYSLVVVSYDYDGSEVVYSLIDDEGDRVWSVPESRLRRWS